MTTFLLGWLALSACVALGWVLAAGVIGSAEYEKGFRHGRQYQRDIEKGAIKE